MFFPDKEKRGQHFVPPLDPVEVFRDAPTLELEVTHGRKLRVRLVTVPIHALSLNPDNPRVRHRTPGDEELVENWLWEETGTRSLYNEIRYSGGLSEKPIIDSSFKVIEGNRRIVCLRRLDDQAKNGELPDASESLFEKIQCFMLPQDVEPRDVALLIARVHVSGKREWSPLNQAEQIFEMVTKRGMSNAEIGSALSISPKKTSLMLQAYQATLDYGKLYPDVEGKWIHKFSYFYELFRNEFLSEWARTPENLQTFFGLISGTSPKIKTGNQVRKLGPIVADPRAINILKMEGFDKALDSVKRKQSQSSEFTKALQRASDTLLEISSGPLRITRTNARLLGDIKNHIEEILRSRSHSITDST